MPYAPFDPAAAAPSSSGWDGWADAYASLGATSPAYALAKELLHELVDEVAPRGWALDFHCGAGDDLGRLAARGWRVAGCDGSAGMLRAAARRAPEALLYHGRAEELEAGSLGGRRFDLVFSATGGFAYLDDDELVRVHRVLAGMLAPGGVMVIAHHGPVCVAETLYHLARLRPRRAVERWRGRVAIEVRGAPMVMRLRSPRRLRRLLDGVVRLERLAPLLVATPPFQSGYAPGPAARACLGALERRARACGALAAIADQVVCVARP